MDSIEDGICGWELNNPDPELFETRISKLHGKDREREFQGKCPGECGSCEFVNECLAPIQFRCLIPKNCEMIELGSRQPDDGAKVTYYSLNRGGKLSFFQLTEMDSSWARIRAIAGEQVPEWALSRMET